MERKTALTDNIVITIIYVIFLVGVIGHIIAATFPLMLKITPYVLLILGHLLILRFAATKSTNVLIWIIAVFLFTFCMEVIGVKTGWIFGEYRYGSTLGSRVFDVPVIIGFNWTFVILGAISLSQRITKNKYLVVLSTGIIAVIFDLILEPIAVRLDYWQWTNNEIPVMNYIAWFLIAVISAILFYVIKPVKLTMLPAKYLLVQFTFFFILSLLSAG